MARGYLVGSQRPTPRLAAVPLPRFADRLSSSGARTASGALVAAVVAIALYTRFGVNGELSRDESVYAYGGQQFSHGVPPYASIFDPKGPLASMLAGSAAAIARLVGSDDLFLIRVTFFVCSVLTVVAIYFLALQLWGSVLGGLVAAVVFACFRGFAADALGGPDAKTPGVLLAVVSMWLLARRQWFWGAFVGSLAVLVWQPFAIYPLVAVVLAAVLSPSGERVRTFLVTVTGAIIPIAVTAIYFVLAGAFGKFVEASLTFPLTGINRVDETVPGRLRHIADVVQQSYKHSAILFWVGLLFLAALIVTTFVQSTGRDAWRNPLICVVATTALGTVAYAASDFQGYPDLFPLLPYPALGLGGAAALAVTLAKSDRARRIVTVAGAVALVAVTVLSLSWFSNDSFNNNDLRAEQAQACAVQRLVTPARPLYALGDPTALVLTHARNPDRFIYLGSGVDDWKIKHTTGGFAGWTKQIRAAHPSAVYVGGWSSPHRVPMERWLRRAGYRPSHIGTWLVYLAPAARSKAPSALQHCLVTD
jgi:hypothetical protein